MRAHGTRKKACKGTTFFAYTQEKWEKYKKLIDFNLFCTHFRFIRCAFVASASLTDDLGVRWEGIISDFSATWDYDGFKRLTTIERRFSNTRYAVGSTLVCDSRAKISACDASISVNKYNLGV